MFKEYLYSINKATAIHPLFYITHKSLNALGLEELLAHYTIISGKDNYLSRMLSNQGRDIHVFPTTPNTSLNLLKNPEVEEYIKKNTHEKPNVMVFKPSKAIEKYIQNSYLSINASAVISERVENKISQYKILQDNGFSEHLPKAYIKRISEVSYEELHTMFGESFVIQFDKGHSGNSTFFIDNKEEFEQFFISYAASEMVMKFSQQLASQYITINASTTKRGTYCGGLCNQLTGLKEIKARRGETCGNNWYQVDVTDSNRSQAIILTEQIGDMLYQIGFRGMFGVDYAIDNEKLYIIEINARQTASTPHFTKLQIENGQVPLEMIHIMEFLNISYDIDRSVYNEENSQPIDASVMVLRNHESKEISIKESFNGLYDIETEEKKEEGYAITEVFSQSRALILEEDEKSTIVPDEEFAIIAMRGNCMKDHFLIDEHIAKFITNIYSHTA